MNAIEFITGEIDESAWGYQERYRIGQDIVVGVNTYKEEDIEVPDLLRVDPESEREQLERLKAFKANRDRRSSAKRLDELRDAAARQREPASADSRGAQGPLFTGRGLRRDAGRVRQVRANVLSGALRGCDRSASLRRSTARAPMLTDPLRLLRSCPGVHIIGRDRRLRRDLRLPDHVRGRRRGRIREACPAHRIEYAIEQQLINPGLLRGARAAISWRESCTVERFYVQWGLVVVIVIGALIGAVMIPTAKQRPGARQAGIARRARETIEFSAETARSYRRLGDDRLADKPARCSSRSSSWRRTA